MAGNAEKIYKLTFEQIYPLWLAKVERKGRSKAELDEVLSWLTGYSEPAKVTGSFEVLFKTQDFHPHADQIKGLICGVRVEAIEDRIVKKVRQIDKVVDELAKGRKIEKIIR